MRRHGMAIAVPAASMVGIVGSARAIETKPEPNRDEREQERRPQRDLLVVRRQLGSRARANLGRNHPDYGMSVAEHEAAKRQRIKR
jgi:hypothetical protein